MNLLRTLKYAGAYNLPEYDIKRGICVGVNIMCLSIFFLNLASGTIFYILTSNLGILTGAFLEAFLVLGIIQLNRHHRYETANICFYIIINLATFYFSAILGKIAEVQLMILFILGLIYFIFERLRTRVFCIVLTFILLVSLEANYVYEFIPPARVSLQVGFLIRWLVYGVTISLVLLIFYLYQENTKLLIQLHTYSKNIKASLLSEERLNHLKNLLFQHISHDIRGAYFGVSSQCNFINHQIQKGKRISIEESANLVDASENYKSILDNFLEISKFKDATIDNIYLESINMRVELKKIVSLNQYIARQKGVTMQMVFSADFPEMIIGDKLKITRIIHNLLSNALKFTSNGSTIDIIIETENGFWQLSIVDQGKGIPADQLKRIFDPFVTEKSAQNPEGVGLGLYITQYLSQLLGAKISVSSEINAGTRFDVRFIMEKRLTN
jgi:two-component system, sensor histidine kinase